MLVTVRAEEREIGMMGAEEAPRGGPVFWEALGLSGAGFGLVRWCGPDVTVRGTERSCVAARAGALREQAGA